MPCDFHIMQVSENSCIALCPCEHFAYCQLPATHQEERAQCAASTVERQEFASAFSLQFVTGSSPFQFSRPIGKLSDSGETESCRIDKNDNLSAHTHTHTHTHNERKSESIHCRRRLSLLSWRGKMLRQKNTFEI